MTTPARCLMALVVLASTLGGCTGYRHVALGPAPPPQHVGCDSIAVGQTVHVQLRDAPSRTITVKAVEQDALVGAKGERIARAQIVWVTRPTTIAGHLKRLALLYGAIILMQVVVYPLYDE